VALDPLKAARFSRRWTFTFDENYSNNSERNNSQHSIQAAAYGMIYRHKAKHIFDGALLLGALLALPSAALADPCKAIPDRGPLPAYLARSSIFSGPVVYIGDGDSLCVAVGSGPENWVEVRVADFYAPELNTPEGKRAKATLERLVKGKRAVCRAEKRSYDRIVAHCEVGGRSIGELMRRAGVESGGNGASASNALYR